MITVVGAGVIGLSTALVLAEQGYKPIKVVSKNFPWDDNVPANYASLWAGAHSRPVPPTTEQSKQHYQRALVTYNWFKKLIAESPDDADKAGIKLLKGYERTPWSNTVVYEGYDDFVGIGPGECSYNTWVLNPPLFLAWLVEKLKALGVEFERKEVTSLDEVAKDGIVINASGTGIGDSNYFPVRGQTFLLDVPADHKYMQSTDTIVDIDQEGNHIWTFTIPRPKAGLIVGTVRQAGDYLGTEREADSKDILDRASKVFPGVEKFPIIKVNVGLRPGRTGGTRLEIDGSNGKIVHAYGFEGFGFEASRGVAEQVGELVKTLEK